jgi:hypothetical protein
MLRVGDTPGALWRNVKGSASTMSVTYTSVLPVRDETVDFLDGLLSSERLRRGTRTRTRSLSCHDQAVLVLRWFLDGTRMSRLARDNAIGKSTGPSGTGLLAS